MTGRRVLLGISGGTDSAYAAQLLKKDGYTVEGAVLKMHEYTDVAAASLAAKELDIEKRQVITNGYFSKDRDKIRKVAERLSECGINDLLLSVDAFHQETIPLEVVMDFAAEAKKCGIPIRLQPAWLVSVTDGNPYNVKTREILQRFDELDFPVGKET